MKKMIHRPSTIETEGIFEVARSLFVRGVDFMREALCVIV